MTLSQDLLVEMHTWRAAWRQIETFLDRIDEMADKDAPHATRTRVLLRLAAFIELERKWRSGDGLNLPLEMARAGDGFDDVWENGQLRRATALDANVETPAPVRDQLEQRLPGLFDMEIAAASLSLPAATDFSEADLKDIRLGEPHTLFERYDVDAKDWVPVRFPIMHFADLHGAVVVDTTKTGLFPLASRKNIVLQSLQTDLPPPTDPDKRPKYHPKLWTTLRSERRDNLPIDLGSELPLLQGDDPIVADRLRSICEDGREAAKQAHDAIKKDGVGPAADVDEDAFLDRLQSMEATFAFRAALYDKIARGQASTFDDAIYPHLLVQVGSNLYQDLYVVLNESVDAQIAYPDGSLRQRRTLEWTFLMHYNARLPWFWYRRERMLKPLLRRFLAPFRQSLRRLRDHYPTTFPLAVSLSRPAAVGDATLQLAPREDGQPHDFKKLAPGQLARLHGERSALALILGVDSPLRADGKVLERLRISPLRVSLATGKNVPGSAGMIERAALLSAHPVVPSDDEIRAGTSAHNPQNDGIISELVSVWSKLCLIAGTHSVEQHPTYGVTLPSPLPLLTHVPVMGTVPLATDRVLVHVRDLKKLGFDPRSPHFARAGEMLLLRGRAEDGDLWQSAVEVRGIVRVAEKDAGKDLSVVMLQKPVCCEGPGEVIAVLISDPKFPVELVKDVRLHRRFRGFGAPSLSSEHILPAVIDPESSDDGEPLSDEDKRVYRGPELDVAIAIVKHWLGDRTAP